MSAALTLADVRADDARLLALLNRVRASCGLEQLPRDYWTVVDRCFAAGVAAARETAAIDLAAERRRRRLQPSATARFMGAG